MDEANRNALINSYYEAIDDEDYAAMEATFASDAQHIRPGQGSLVGAAAIREFFETERQSSNTFHDVTKRFHDDEGSYCMVTVSGELPDGPFEGDVFAEFEFDADEEHITKYRVYRGYSR